jgi:predicted PurR-regulated permease PerM
MLILDGTELNYMIEKSKDSWPYSVKLAAQLICLVLIVGIIYYLQGLVLLLIFSMMMAMILFPLANRLEKWRLPRVLSSLVCIIVAVVVLVAVFYLIVNQVLSIGRNGSDLVTKFEGIYHTIMNWAEQQFGVSQRAIVDRVKASADNAMSNATSYLQTAFSSIGGLLGNTLLVPVFVFFMLTYRDFFREFFFFAFKSSDQNRINAVLMRLYGVVHSYLFGLITVMGIVAVLNTVGLLVLGIEYAWFFGTLASLLMLFPYIGIAIGSILPALFALATKDSIWYTLGVIGWFQFVQFLEGNIITPKIVGSKVSINPLMSILCIILGGILFGLPGLILALPMTAMLKVIFDEIPAMAHFGFLIGETEKYHLKRGSRIIVMKRWQLSILPRKKPADKSKS